VESECGSFQEGKGRRLIHEILEWKGKAGVNVISFYSSR
jgi:hypothetical protein